MLKLQVFKGIALVGGMGNDCNVYVVDGELLVDAGSGLNFSDMKEEIENLGIDTSKIKVIINTHCHFDHTGGDKKMRDWLGAQIGIHKDDARALETGIGTLSERFGQTARIVTADKQLKDGDIINTTHFDFTVIHTPGHTPGSICLFDDRKKLLISGDTLFSEGHGRTDIPGANADQLMNSLEILQELGAMYILPGHGQAGMGNVSFLVKQILARASKKDF